uniref:mannose-1-phosphate guanylyltransferase n=1 Tax=Leersia perrieri TaxID=77586 RepID=A0A0D9V7R8_9ORYZ
MAPDDGGDARPRRPRPGMAAAPAAARWRRGCGKRSSLCTLHFPPHPHHLRWPKKTARDEEENKSASTRFVIFYLRLSEMKKVDLDRALASPPPSTEAAPTSKAGLVVEEGREDLLLIEALKEVGVTEVVLAINYRPEVMLNFLKDFEDKLGITITCSQETEPLGTAGPLALARDKLVDGSGDPFFVLNSDVISEYPFAELIKFHKNHGGEATIMVTKVDEPSKYGVVVMEEATGMVEKFVEKPKVFVGNKINAGIYLLNPSVLDRIELKPTSIEKEIFPRIAADAKLFAMVLPGFWMDVGQPRDYITGLHLYLDSLRKRSADRLATGTHIVGNVLVHESAKIGEGCLIGPDVAIGPGCVVEDGVRLSRCTVMRGVRIKKHACISNSIIGWHSTVGQWARIENITILGEDVHVGDEVYTNGGVVLPHKEIKSSILKPQIVM